MHWDGRQQTQTPTCHRCLLREGLDLNPSRVLLCAGLWRKQGGADTLLSHPLWRRGGHSHSCLASPAGDQRIILLRNRKYLFFMCTTSDSRNFRFTIPSSGCRQSLKPSEQTVLLVVVTGTSSTMPAKYIIVNTFPALPCL